MVGQLRLTGTVFELWELHLAVYGGFYDKSQKELEVDRTRRLSFYPLYKAAQQN